MIKLCSKECSELQYSFNYIIFRYYSNNINKTNKCIWIIINKKNQVIQI